METLYPSGYGIEMVTLAKFRAMHQPHMHPEAYRRGEAFVVAQGGKFGVGGGYRAPGTQPNKPGFAPPGDSFHEGQRFPSGLYYAAWDMVIVNPGLKHRVPQWVEVPRQGTPAAKNCGMHMNVSTEAWHMQPVELDGHDSWVKHGCPDLKFNYPVVGLPTEPVPDPLPDPNVFDPQHGLFGAFPSSAKAIIKLGAQGDLVKYMQGVFLKMGYAISVDGSWGAKTDGFVQWFQTAEGLTVDKIVGPKSWVKIDQRAVQ
jgi:Putative peptidoglycan binding domain